MDSPNSTKSRGSRKNAFIDLLKPELDKMKDSCSKYRQENAFFRKEMNRLRSERYEDKQRYENEISRLNDQIRELQSKAGNGHQINHQLDTKLSNHQSNRHPNTNVKQLFKENHLNHDYPLNNRELIENLLAKDGINDCSTKQYIGLTLEEWFQQSNEKFRTEVNKKVEHVKQNFLMQLEQEIEFIIGQIITQSNNKKQQQSNVLNELNINEQCTLKIAPDIKLVLKPLKKLIESINRHFETKKLETQMKIDELENSQRLLENSLNRTRLVDHELQNEKLNELNGKVNLLDEENQQLKQIIIKLEKKEENLNERNRQLMEKNHKLFEDNKKLNDEEAHYADKIKELENELKYAKKEITELKQKNDFNFESKEQTILGKIKKDNENLVKVLNNKFSELLNELKDTINTIFPNDKKKVYDQINKFLIKFHQFANDKIHENTILVESYATRNISMSYMEMPSTFGNLGKG